MKFALSLMVIMGSWVSFADPNIANWVVRSHDLPPLNQMESIQYCRNQGGRIPSPEDVKQLVASQFNFTPLENVIEYGTYWTSEVHPYSLGVEFFSPDGSLGVTNRGNRNSVVCIQ
jgi:hypothetical protein